jgi:hypothetical protein
MPVLFDAFRLPQVALVLVFSSALASACTDDPNLDTDAPDGGVDSGGVDRAQCPTASPQPGELCLLPEGTTCAFGLCGALARCTRSAWTYGENPPPRPPCPDTPPDPETSCPPCWPEKATCTYGSLDCTAPDASDNTAVASCEEGTWSIAFAPCRDGGGPDVQGDAGPDAD